MRREEPVMVATAAAMTAMISGAMPSPDTTGERRVDLSAAGDGPGVWGAEAGVMSNLMPLKKAKTMAAIPMRRSIGSKTQQPVFANMDRMGGRYMVMF